MKAAQSICNGKFINAGQTCIAPDYVLVEQTIKDAFINALQYVINEWYPNVDDNNHIRDSYGKIINEHHFNRIMGYLNTDKYSGVVFGGKYDREKFVMYPTIVSDPSDDHPLMNEEIFGPILPVKSVSNVEEAMNIINKKPKPLVIYLYTQNKSITNDVVNRTSSGSVCVNDCLVQITIPNVPFGGVGLSGINKLNWHDSFKTFSNRKAVVRRSDKFDIVNRKFLYPPHTKRKAKIMMDIIESTTSTKTIIRIAYISSFIVASAVLISFGFFIGRINK
ncbi:hypothetical protein GJ496_003773 [Pomphorhynchus laevis]|nr:hypothetical protein GJ496_003773 [Pomphorhynchus laevis]